MTPGIYHLLIHLSKDTTIEVGKLGSFSFPAGYYVYTGSALSGLESRIARHLRREKRLHWHIDYLLQHGRVVDIITHRTAERLECWYNQMILSLPDCEIPVRGFGSSDCSCSSHLAYFRKRPQLLRHS
jgi:Uri superfamily endonuclease